MRRGPLVEIYATGRGGQTLDEGEGGGNPFASAFVELMSRDHLTLSDVSRDIVKVTDRKSRGFQQAEAPNTVPDVLLRPAPADEARLALVLVHSDYSASNQDSLPGAAHDALRVGRALNEAGFATTVAIDPPRATLGDVSAGFVRRSAGSDLAVLYVTGHGVQAGNAILLLATDSPTATAGDLAKSAIDVSSLAESMQASKANVLLYAGCRDNPFGT